MPTHLPASRTCWLFCCATLAAAVAFPPLGLGQEYVEIAGRTADSSSLKKITVQMWVVEVSTDKLRNLGFDWDVIRSTNKEGILPVEKLEFLKSLEQNNLARMLAEPTIATVSGRKASLAVGEQLKLDVTPTAIDDKHIQLQYRVEVGAAGREGIADATPFVAGSTVQVEAGKPCLVSQTRSSWQTANGKPRQTETLLMVQADLVTPHTREK